MLDQKLQTLLAVAEYRNYTRAAEKLALTQPAVSHHITGLEEELGVRLFVRNGGVFRPTPEGEIVIRYAKRMQALYGRMREELGSAGRHLTRLRIGITHTAESNQITEALARYTKENRGISITVITDTIKNLYTMLESYDLDLAVAEGKPNDPALYSILLDTDFLVCAMSNNNPLSRQSLVTLNELKRERMILRLPSSATRIQFESTLESINESIDAFDVALEVDNIATIKDLIRKDMGVSILARSACMDEVRKGKMTVLPIENLSMIRETNLVYHRDFTHLDVLQDLTRVYRETARGGV